MDQFTEHRDKMHSKDIKTILVGHKLKNFKNYDREIKEKDARNHAKKYNVEFRELSVSDHSIHSLFKSLAVNIKLESNHGIRAVPPAEDPFNKMNEINKSSAHSHQRAMSQSVDLD